MSHFQFWSMGNEGGHSGMISDLPFSLVFLCLQLSLLNELSVFPKTGSCDIVGELLYCIDIFVVASSGGCGALGL